ncbi:MAG TPA: thioredoxin domain-containing protein [Vicinamibacteria bacterium]|nr:thioredoxin domain-containing protein [Vicinamibacteria bacterium]
MLRRRPHSFLLLLPVVAVAACSRAPGAASPGSSPAPAAASSPTVSGVGVVAEIDGAPILAADLEQKAAGRLARVRQEEYEIRRQALDDMIGERLLAAEAARRGISPEALLKREVTDKVEPVSESRVGSIYDENAPSFGATPKAQAMARIREVMNGRAQGARRAAFLKELRDKARVAVRLEPPRVTVAIPDNAPVDGPAGAPVSIVEFTDYQCPYCHRAQSVIEQVLSRYQGKVRLVHMDFPLDGHPGAFPAARAARCAGEQGRFWEYHRGLMNQSGALDEADLKGRADKLGLKAADFASCLGAGRHDEEIRAAFEQGESLGVTGTPAYFVNGRMISGARPLEDFTQVIDAELATR